MNFAIDQKYPNFYSLFGEHIRLSTLMTRKPLVYSGGMVFSFLGDQFDRRFVDEADFVPSLSNNVPMRALPKGSYNSQFLFSQDFVGKTLTGFYTLRPMNIDSSFTAWKFFILDVPNCQILIDETGITMNHVNIHFYNQLPDTSSLVIQKGGYEMKLNITLRIDSFDVPNSKMFLKVKKIEAISFDSSVLQTLIAKPLNSLLRLISKIIALSLIHI